MFEHLAIEPVRATQALGQPPQALGPLRVTQRGLLRGQFLIASSITPAMVECRLSAPFDDLRDRVPRLGLSDKLVDQAVGDRPAADRLAESLPCHSQTTSIVEVVAYKSDKTKHAGAKNGGGVWMTRAEAKEAAKRKRRQLDKQALDPWTDPDPQAGDFDFELARARPGQIEIHEGDPDAEQLLPLDPRKAPEPASD
jgi:hypothetical protein